MISILYLVPSMIIGGAEKQLLELIRHIDDKKFRSIVCCIHARGPFYKNLTDMGIKTYFSPTKKLFPFNTFFRILRIIKKEKIDILYCHGFSAKTLGRIAAIVLRVPVKIVVEHSTITREDRPFYHKIIDNFLSYFTDSFIAVARALKKNMIEVRGIDEEKISIIYNGITPDDYNPHTENNYIRNELGIRENIKVAGILAALRPEKDHINFLDAARMVLQKNRDVCFLIVGDGAERASLEEHSSKLGIGDRVIFTGFRHDIPEILSVFNIAILSSYTIETFPVSFLEAMAMEKPLVATEVGGITEMVTDGVNGFLVPPRNPGALAHAMLKILSDDALETSMGKKSREIFLENFTVDKMVRQFEDMFTQLISNKSPGKKIDP